MNKQNKIANIYSCLELHFWIEFCDFCIYSIQMLSLYVDRIRFCIFDLVSLLQVYICIVELKTFRVILIGAFDEWKLENQFDRDLSWTFEDNISKNHCLLCRAQTTKGW